MGGLIGEELRDDNQTNNGVDDAAFGGLNIIQDDVPQQNETDSTNINDNAPNDNFS